MLNYKTSIKTHYVKPHKTKVTSVWRLIYQGLKDTESYSTIHIRKDLARMRPGTGS